MCKSLFIQYTCGCRKEMEFIQCPDRHGTNVQCHPVPKEWGKDANNYCSGHLVKADSSKKYTDRKERIVEE